MFKFNRWRLVLHCMARRWSVRTCCIHWRFSLVSKQLTVVRWPAWSAPRRFWRNSSRTCNCRNWSTTARLWSNTSQTTAHGTGATMTSYLRPRLQLWKTSHSRTASSQYAIQSSCLSATSSDIRRWRWLVAWQLFHFQIGSKSLEPHSILTLLRITAPNQYLNLVSITSAHWGTSAHLWMTTWQSLSHRP